VGQVVAHHGGGGGILLDEIRPLRPTGKGFDADAAGPGVEIEHPVGLNPKRRQHRKEGAPDLVGHRPGKPPRGTFQLESAPFSGNDPHG
jgi:hypothetical protein